VRVASEESKSPMRVSDEQARRPGVTTSFSRSWSTKRSYRAEPVGTRRRSWWARLAIFTDAKGV